MHLIILQLFWFNFLHSSMVWKCFEIIFYFLQFSWAKVKVIKFSESKFLLLQLCFVCLSKLMTCVTYTRTCTYVPTPNAHTHTHAYVLPWKQHGESYIISNFPLMLPQHTSIHIHMYIIMSATGKFPSAIFTCAYVCVCFFLFCVKNSFLLISNLM